MRRTLFVSLVAAVLTAAFGATAAQANHPWNTYHWARTANPFTLLVGDNVSSTWDAYLDGAISDWNASTVMDLTEVTGQGTKRCRATSGRVEVCNGTYGNNGWLGLASISISGSHITQGTAKVNDSYYTAGSKYDTPYWRAHVMCQEVGHDFGLGHQDESGADLHTCMDYYNMAQPHDHTMHPNQHDYDQLVSIYSHLDSTTTIGALAASTQAENEDARPERVDRADRIAASTITEHFGDGSRRITEIYWALDGRGRS